MRIKCEYKAERLPIGYNMLFVSMIKEAMRRTDEEYFQSLYTFEGSKSNKRSKNFVFSVYLNGYHFEENSISLDNGLIFNVSSPDCEFLINLYNGLIKLPVFSYKEYELKRLGTGLVKEKGITGSEAVFKTLSPICIKNRQQKFLLPGEEGFEEELNYICDISLKNYRGAGLDEKLGFKALQMKKVIVKESIRKFSENTGKNLMLVLSSGGTFRLSGSREDLTDLYALGIGFKRSQGFGMVEIS